LSRTSRTTTHTDARYSHTPSSLPIANTTIDAFDMPSEEQTYRAFVSEKLDNIDKRGDRIEKMVAYTNGKVRKIIIAMVLLSGIVIGMNYSNWRDIIALLISLH
jgi:hypothetical protein